MPNATADPLTERMKHFIRQEEAAQSADSNEQAQAIADTAREIDIATMALNDDLFLAAVTPRNMLTRLNQIRSRNGLAELNSLPTELESPGFIANLKKEYPKAVLRFMESDAAQAVGHAFESNSIGLARAIVRGEQPAGPPEGAGFRILSDIGSLLSDPLTYVGGGAGKFVAKKVVGEVGKSVAKRAAARGITTGTTLATLTAVRDPLGQQATTGDIDPGQTGIETLKAGALGAAAGGAGAIGGKVVGTALEIGTFTQGGALLDPEGPRLATLDDLIHSTGVILGLRGAGLVQRRLGTGLFKKSRGEQLTPEEQQAVDQTPQTVKERILLDAKETPATAEQTFTKEELLTREGAQQFSVLHPDTAKALVDAPTASRKSFEPLKKLLPDVGKEMNAAERNQLRAYLHEIAGKPVVTDQAEPGAPPPPTERLPSAPTPGAQARPSIRVGQKVRPTDRRNLGTVVSVSEDGAEARVRFVNRKTGETATKTFPVSQLQSGSRPPVSRETALTAEPMPEPGAKLDKLQETVVNNAQTKATADTPAEAVLVVPMDAVVRSSERGINPAKRFYRYLTTGGPHEDVKAASVESEAFIRAELRDVKFALDDYRRGVRKEFGLLGRVPQETLDAVNAYLKERGPLDAIPESMQGAVMRFRNSVDAMSQRGIDDGVIQGKMVGVFTDNYGAYLHRDYKIFHINPAKVHKYVKKLKPGVVNKGIALLREQAEEAYGRKLTPEEDLAYLEAFLYKAARRGNFIDAVQGGDIGVKALNILRHKGDLPKALRDIYGEETDPSHQFANTRILAARHFASVKALGRIREAGLNKWLFEQPQGPFMAEVKGSPGDPLYPLLQGKKLYTTPALESSMRKHFGPTPVSALPIRAYFWLNSTTKINKTAGSVAGIMRNFLWNFPIAIANGHLDPTSPIRTVKNLLKAGRIIATDLAPGIARFTRLSSREQQAELKELISFDVINASAQAGEMRMLAKDYLSSGNASNFIESKVKTFGKFLTRFGVPKKMIDAFMSGDDFWHAHGYYMEIDNLRAAFPNKPLSELKVLAAANIVAGYPTYSQAPFIIQQFRKAVFFGDFVTFTSEMVRTTKNIPQMAAREIADPATREMGIKRALGFVAMGTGIASIGPASRAIVGISKKEEEALRTLSPDWMRNSTWAFVGRPERLKYRTIDTQYSIPQSFMTNPIIAALRGEDVEESTKGALTEILRPFFNETILSQVVGDLWANQKISQGSSALIYNPEAPRLDQAVALEEFFRSRLQPGTVRSLEKIWKGVIKKPLASGRIPDVGTEVLATMLGLRIVTHDVPRQFGFAMSTQLDRRSNARRIFYTTAYARDGRDAGEIQDAYDKSVEAERDIFKTMQGLVSAAKVPGMTNKEIRDVMNDKRVAISKADADRIIEGTYDESKLLKSMVWALSGREFDERIPRLLKALGVSASEAESFLMEHWRDGGSTPKLETMAIRISRLRKRIL